jgi:hypothetical protein
MEKGGKPVTVNYMIIIRIAAKSTREGEAIWFSHSGQAILLLFCRKESPSIPVVRVSGVAVQLSRRLDLIVRAGIFYATGNPRHFGTGKPDLQ